MNVLALLKRGFCLFVLLLTVAVAGREVPECLTLTNDVSNDGMVTTVDTATALPAIEREPAGPSTALPAALALSPQRPRSTNLRHPWGRGSQSLLRLLSLQRK
jgi:hypothetical protein